MLVKNKQLKKITGLIGIAFVFLAMFIMVFLTTTPVQAQAAPGAAAFVGYNADSGDDFALVFFRDIDDIAPNLEIYITDRTWDGSIFFGGEGTIVWTVPAGGVSAGTVILFTDPSGTGTPSVNIGSFVEIGGFNMGVGGDTLYVYVGTDEDTPTTFLTALATDTEGFSPALPPGLGVLTNTGLVEDSSAINFGSIADGIDGAEYTGSRVLTDMNSYGPVVNNTANWTNVGSGGNGDSLLPHSGTAFDGTPTSVSFQSITSSNQSASFLPIIVFVILALIFSGGVVFLRQNNKSIG